MRLVACLLMVMMCTAGCETYLDETKSGALAGGGLGAGLGAIIGNQTGHAGAGTAIGAGAGALAGALMGEGIKRARTANQQTTAQPYTTTQYQQQTAPVQQQYAAPAKVQEVHTKYCPTCGKTYPEASKFCSNDGAELKYIQ